MTVTVDVGDDGVEVGLSGWDRVWAFRSRVWLPAATITGACVAPVAELREERGWRLGGTGAPGMCWAGNFMWRPDRPGERQFWSTYRDPDALVIETLMPIWSRVVLQHPDREALAAEITERYA